MSDAHHMTLYFSGRVQGVGFRYAVMQVAKGFEVAGFVTNLPDGRVLVEAEGGMAELEAFAAAIEQSMEGYIRKVDRSHRERTPQFEGFTIK
jgi:acylphosphatase